MLCRDLEDVADDGDGGRTGWEMAGGRATSDEEDGEEDEEGSEEGSEGKREGQGHGEKRGGEERERDDMSVRDIKRLEQARSVSSQCWTHLHGGSSARHLSTRSSNPVGLGHYNSANAPHAWQSNMIVSYSHIIVSTNGSPHLTYRLSPVQQD